MAVSPVGRVGRINQLSMDTQILKVALSAVMQPYSEQIVGSAVEVWYALAAVMLPVATNEALVMLNSSAVAVISVPVTRPPVISTLPSCSRVASCPSRGVVILAVGEKVCVDGSKISAEFRISGFSA